MKETFFVLLCLAFLGGCIGDEPDCPGPDEHWIAVGFYRSGEAPGWDTPPIDTTFSSIYPVGNRAELAPRRIDNFFLLPIPHAGGKVDYVFQQNDRQDTLSLFFTTKAELYPADCGLLMKTEQVEVLQESTTIAAESIQQGRFFYYDEYKIFSGNLAVFVP